MTVLTPSKPHQHIPVDWNDRGWKTVAFVGGVLVISCGMALVSQYLNLGAVSPVEVTQSISKILMDTLSAMLQGIWDLLRTLPWPRTT